MEFPHAFGFQIVNTPPCPQNSIIVNPPSPSEILKAVRGIVWIFSGIAHSVSFQSFVLRHLLFATYCNIFLHLCYIAAGTVMLPSNLNNRQVSDTLLHDLVEDLSTSWKMLGRRLGIPEGAITNIDMEHRRVVEKGMAMFAEWKRRRGAGATMGVLREALDKTGRRDLSERVRGKVDL